MQLARLRRRKNALALIAPDLGSSVAAAAVAVWALLRAQKEATRSRSAAARSWALRQGAAYRVALRAVSVRGVRRPHVIISSVSLSGRSVSAAQ